MRLVDFKTAQALAKLGYDGEYTKVYQNKIFGDDTTLTITDKSDNSFLYVPAPRLDDAAYWIRDNFGIAIIPMPLWCYKNIWDCKLVFFDESKEEFLHEEEENPESALNLGVNYIISLLKPKI